MTRMGRKAIDKVGVNYTTHNLFLTRCAPSLRVRIQKKGNIGAAVGCWCRGRLQQYAADAGFQFIWNHGLCNEVETVNVDSTSDPKGIGNIFKDHFKVEPTLPVFEMLYVEFCCVELPFSISAKDVRLALNDMKKGKSPGHDGLSIKHLRHAGPHIYRILCMLFIFF